MRRAVKGGPRQIKDAVAVHRGGRNAREVRHSRDGDVIGNGMFSFPERPVPLGCDGADGCGSSVHCSQAPPGEAHQKASRNNRFSTTNRIHPQENQARTKKGSRNNREVYTSRSTENQLGVTGGDFKVMDT